MDLRRRLAALDRLTRRPDAPAGQAVASSVAAADIEAGLTALGLARRDTVQGPLWWRERRDRIGAPPLLLPDLRGFFTRGADLRPAGGRVLFLDTETTGLAGGTGTLAFLVGASWWENAEFVTQQYFLPGPGQEGPLLAALAELAHRGDIVVTYNGASFDLPLLRTRALLNRQDDPLASLISWDLLVPSRRLWARQLSDCRQQTVESHVCGQQRGPGDIDGARIPQTWFDFLSSGAVTPLAPVLTHNHRDMLGMAMIFLRVLDAAAGIADTDVGSGGWREAWALGRIAERRREHASAVSWLARAAQAAAVRDGPGRDGPERDDPWCRRTFLADAVRILKRGGDWPLVEQVIQSGLAAEPDQAWLHREAAILYEHRLVRMQAALHHARLAGDRRREDRLLRRLACG